SAFSVVSSKVPRAVLARSTNSSTAGGTSSGASGYSLSTAILNGVLLVATIRSSGAMRDQLGHLGRDCDELLEVVQEEERLLVADQRGDAFTQRPLLGLLHVQCVRERRDE